MSGFVYKDPTAPLQAAIIDALTPVLDPVLVYPSDAPEKAALPYCIVEISELQDASTMSLQIWEAMPTITVYGRGTTTQLTPIKQAILAALADDDNPITVDGWSVISVDIETVKNGFVFDANDNKFRFGEITPRIQLQEAI